MAQESLKRKRDIKSRRKQRIRGRVSGTLERPRLNVSRSLQNMYLQIINDETGEVLVSFNDATVGKDKKMTRVERAYQAGKELAEKAVTKGISKIVFDRGGNKYHGRVKAVADGVRKGGLIF